LKPVNVGYARPRRTDTNTNHTSISFPFAFEVFLTVFRSPEYISLAASANLFEDEPDFASKARTAAIPMEPFGADFNFLIAVFRTMVSLFESSNLTLFFTLAGKSLSLDNAIG